PVVPSKTVWDISQRSLKELLPFAEKAGVAICVENVWNKFLTGPFELAQYIDSFQSPFVKSYFDAGNVLLTGYPEHWIEILGGKRIGRVHVKNFTAHDGGGTLADFTDSLMKGTLNWEAVFGALKNAGYDGYVTPEMLVSDKGLPDPELARQVAKDMRKLLEQYG
ncbi:MAG TPA: sugar phosphate isomerase/epimerase family protein, partial [Candidatus Hydrogenedentes bacterium]|nr:sugar phosphate isomerase/epimerase family protein [Candidatus Hydrogenedentota bacterium]